MNGTLESDPEVSLDTFIILASLRRWTKTLCGDLKMPSLGRREVSAFREKWVQEIEAQMGTALQ